jgi:hypothetical protein
VELFLGHLQGLGHCCKLTLEEGNLMDDASASSQTKVSTTTLSTSHTRVGSIHDIGICTPPQNKHYRKNDRKKGGNSKEAKNTHTIFSLFFLS